MTRVVVLTFVVYLGAMSYLVVVHFLPLRVVSAG
jgi:hypothetical protein